MKKKHNDKFQILKKIHIALKMVKAFYILRFFSLCIFSAGLFSVVWHRPVKSGKHILTKIECHYGRIFFFDKKLVLNILKRKH